MYFFSRDFLGFCLEWALHLRRWKHRKTCMAVVNKIITQVSYFGLRRRYASLQYVILFVGVQLVLTTSHLLSTDSSPTVNSVTLTRQSGLHLLVSELLKVKGWPWEKRHVWTSTDFAAQVTKIGIRGKPAGAPFICKMQGFSWAPANCRGSWGSWQLARSISTDNDPHDAVAFTGQRLSRCCVRSWQLNLSHACPHPTLVVLFLPVRTL